VNAKDGDPEINRRDFVTVDITDYVNWFYVNVRVDDGIGEVEVSYDARRDYCVVRSSRECSFFR
jgi:hypothetical protein